MVISLIDQLVRVRVELTGCGSADAHTVIFSSHVTYSIKLVRNACIAYMWVNEADVFYMKHMTTTFEGLTIQITKGTEVL